MSPTGIWPRLRESAAADRVRWLARRLAERLAPHPSPGAAWRGAGALVLVAVAGGVASVRSPGLIGWGVALTATAVALVAAGLAIRRPQVVSAGVVAGGVAVAIGLIRRGGVDATGAIEGTALLLAAELAWWSLERWIPIAAEPGTDQPRWLTLAALALAGLGMGSAATALVAGGVLGRRTGAGGALLESLGAAGAVAVVALVLVVAGLGDRRSGANSPDGGDGR